MSGDRRRLRDRPLRRGLPVVAVLLAAAAAGGCDGTTDLDRTGEPLVRTDARTYRLRETPAGRGLRVEIPYRYENRTGRTICVPNCRGGFVIGLVDESGELAWSPVILACRSPAITVAAGEILRDTLHVFHGLEPDSRPRFEGDPEGTFRIDVRAAHWDGGSCGAEQVPRELRTSNPFELERE